MYRIGKEFEFCYGHRVWNQKLSTNQECKCKHLHGHNGKIILELGSGNLKNDMVYDYQDLDPFKKWVDRMLDHRMILDLKDPCIESLLYERIIIDEQILSVLEKDFIRKNEKGFYLVEDIYVKDEYLRGSFVLMKGVPTSENMCRLIYEEWSKEYPLVEVRFKETGKTEAGYYE